MTLLSVGATVKGSCYIVQSFTERRVLSSCVCLRVMSYLGGDHREVPFFVPHFSEDDCIFVPFSSPIPVVRAQS